MFIREKTYRIIIMLFIYLKINNLYVEFSDKILKFKMYLKKK